MVVSDDEESIIIKYGGELEEAYHREELDPIWLRNIDGDFLYKALRNRL